MSRLALGFVRPASLVTAALIVAGIAGCAGDGPGPMQQSAAPAPPAIPASAIAGRWGLASYHRDEDRARTEQAARGVCGNPYVIAPDIQNMQALTKPLPATASQGFLLVE
jgi:hypothetical protein